MRSRLAARLVTGPFAFLLAVVVDVVVVWTVWAAGRARSALVRRAGR